MAASSLPRLWPVPSQEELQTIIQMKDPVLRNLHITQTYHVLTVALTELFGEENVSWCAYATWASKTAGFFIRKDVVPALIHDFLQRADALTRSIAELQDRLLGPWSASVGVQFVLTQTISEVTDEVSRQTARGNHLVFTELAPLYAAMLEAFKASEHHDPEVLGHFLKRLTPGPVEQGGQDLLIRAVTHYHAALFEEDPRARAELLFLANALVGYHEQVRLQEPIVAALNAPLREVFLDCLVRYAGVSGERPVERGFGYAERSLRTVFSPLATRLERLWRELSTRSLMRIELPDAALRLGEDIPALNAEHDFPPHLLRLEHPELVALMARLDRTTDDTAGSAARDWGNLMDRMNLIVDLFRTRQQDRVLYDQPFTFMQVEAFRQGRVPHGRL
jgi:hypothetical protein